MADAGWGLWGSWEETESFIGKPVGISRGADAIELGGIRRWLEPKEFDCSLHYDAAAAQAAGFKDIVAPATMAFTAGLAPSWSPGDPAALPGEPGKQIDLPVIFSVPAPCNLSFATSVEIEFFEPMYVGDHITCTSILASVFRKQLKVGDGAFLRQEDTYTNQRGERVALANLDIFRFVAPSEDQA